MTWRGTRTHVEAEQLTCKEHDEDADSRYAVLPSHTLSYHQPLFVCAKLMNYK